MRTSMPEQGHIFVNTANHRLLGGGGFRRGQTRSCWLALLVACRLLNGCETGEVKFIIHAAAVVLLSSGA
jgi:hypothetical protein